MAKSRICGKVKLIPDLRLRVRAFAQLKRRMTDDFLLFHPNDEAKTLGGLCGRSYSKLVIPNQERERERERRRHEMMRRRRRDVVLTAAHSK